MTPQERAAAIIGGHYDCEDPWYSCPLSPDGCANANMGKECTCGYDDRKQNVERLIAETRRAALLEAVEFLKLMPMLTKDNAIAVLTRLAQEG